MARIVRCPQADLSERWRAEQLRLHRQAWPGTGDADHDPLLDPLTLLLVDGRRALATLDILSKDLEHRGRRYQASGLSAVVTDRAERGRGLGLILVRAAFRTIAETDKDLGIFTCDTELAGFYVKAGWQLLPGTVLIGGTAEDPLPSDRFDKLTLGSFFSQHAREHATDFERARIELYPGQIDKLW